MEKDKGGVNFSTRMYKFLGTFHLLRTYMAFMMKNLYSKSTRYMEDIGDEEKIRATIENYKNFFEQLLGKFSSISKVTAFLEGEDVAITFKDFKFFDGYVPSIKDVQDCMQNGTFDKLRVPYWLTKY